MNICYHLKMNLMLSHIYWILSRNVNVRFVFAKLRCGILPLHIKTGQYTNTALKNRLCEFCGKNVVEREKHFICLCSLYNDFRNSLYLNINYTQPELQSISDNDKFVYILQNKQHLVTKFCHQTFSKRRQKLNN